MWVSPQLLARAQNGSGGCVLYSIRAGGYVVGVENGVMRSLTAEEEAEFQKLPNGERRVALGRRRRVAEMSPEELLRELLTSEVTGLQNRRAFDEAGVALAV